MVIHVGLGQSLQNRLLTSSCQLCCYARTCTVSLRWSTFHNNHSTFAPTSFTCLTPTRTCEWQFGQN